MTLDEMTSRVKELLDITDNTQDTLTLIKNSLNAAYMTVARDKFRLVKKEQKSVTNGQIAISSLSESFIALKTVTSLNGERIAAWAGYDYIHICSSVNTVYVEYFYLPAVLTASTDSPVISEAQVDPYAYIYFAVSLYLNTKHLHQEASVWDIRYKNIADNIHETRKTGVMPKSRWC